MSQTEYDPTSLSDCPAGGRCPGMLIRTIGGDQSNTDCAAAVLEKYGTSPVVITFCSYRSVFAMFTPWCCLRPYGAVHVT